MVESSKAKPAAVYFFYESRLETIIAKGLLRLLHCRPCSFPMDHVPLPEINCFILVVLISYCLPCIPLRVAMVGGNPVPLLHALSEGPNRYQ